MALDVFPKILRPLETVAGEASPHLPLVEISGTEKILVENHRGILEFKDSCIRILVIFGEICLMGQGLTIASMTAQQLLIQGQLEQILYLRGGAG